ncbi:thiamine pyrophosphate-dependent enzyme [Sphingobacterium sp. LRF_L2]|uniref:thiamine pyrophosphate-dependent enzyme n=1 Tax=Sphingobacterium sp. LRF_L2 TaxID=3369421 RepID=UPI003F5F460C
MAKNVSDHLVEMLKQVGIKRVYAITGDSLNPVNDAIRRDGTIEWIHVRHEETAAYAASMDAELNGIGCCMGSSGPGHVHLVNGLYDANRSSNPVIAIASTCATDKFGTDYFQETNPEKLFSDCSKAVFMATTSKMFGTMIQRTIQTAVNEKGVAVLGLPGDVASAEYEEVLSGSKAFLTKPIYRPSEEELAEFAHIINSNKKIAFYCGHGCKDAVKEIELIAEKINAPIAYSFRGKIFFDSVESPFAVGMNGLLGNKSGYETCNEADVLILWGTDFPYSEFLPQKNIIIQIDRSPQRIGRRAHVDYGYAGDVRETAVALLPKLEIKSDNGFLKKMKELYAKDETAFHDFGDKKGAHGRIEPEYIATLIDHYSSDDAIYTVDTGMTSVWAARFIRAKGLRYLTGSFNHGSMANALPMAIGAAAAKSGRQVVAMCGDGGLSMLLGDLAVIMQYQYPVKIFVFNNHSLAMVKLEMEVAGYVDWQTDMVNPPFDRIAELMNIKGVELKDPNQAEAVISQAFEHEGPVLVNIYTNPDTLAMPPHITFEQMKGFATSLVKKVGMGRFSEVKEAVKTGIGHIGDIL